MPNFKEHQGELRKFKELQISWWLLAIWIASGTAFPFIVKDQPLLQPASLDSGVSFSETLTSREYNRLHDPAGRSHKQGWGHGLWHYKHVCIFFLSFFLLLCAHLGNFYHTLTASLWQIFFLCQCGGRHASSLGHKQLCRLCPFCCGIGVWQLLFVVVVVIHKS